MLVHEPAACTGRGEQPAGDDRPGKVPAAADPYSEDHREKLRPPAGRSSLGWDWDGLRGSRAGGMTAPGARPQPRRCEGLALGVEAGSGRVRPRSAATQRPGRMPRRCPGLQRARTRSQSAPPATIIVTRGYGGPTGTHDRPKIARSPNGSSARSPPAQCLRSPPRSHPDAVARGLLPLLGRRSHRSNHVAPAAGVHVLGGGSVGMQRVGGHQDPAQIR